MRETGPILDKNRRSFFRILTGCAGAAALSGCSEPRPEPAAKATAAEPARLLTENDKFDIAGRGKAHPGSMTAAINLAIDLAEKQAAGS